MEHFYIGFAVALGACAGMVAWQFVAYFLKGVSTIFAAVWARISPPTFINGKGEKVEQTPPKKGGGK